MKKSELISLIQEVISEINLNEKGRCWDGWEPVPGKRPYSQDSCRKVEEIDTEEAKNTARRVKEIGAGILAKNCGKTVAQIMKDFDRDYWMDAKQAIEYGITDKLIDKI